MKINTVKLAIITVIGFAYAVGAMTDAERHNSAMMNAAPAESMKTNGDVRVVFVGNSITLHGKAPQIGWPNEWGMAASTAENDYVHLVTAGIEKKSGRKAAVMVKNLASFERNYRTYDFAGIDDLVAFRPDYLIVALGENVPNLTTEDDRLAYRTAFKQLLSRFTYDRMQPNAVVRGVFWPNPVKDELMAHAASDFSFTFVKADFYNKETRAGTNRFSHAGVAGHPGDYGMKKIADAILEGLFPSKSGYTATMNGSPVAIRPIRISAMPFNQWAPDYQRPMNQTEIAGMINVEADGPAEWRVRADRAFKRAVVRPSSRGVNTKVVNGEICFTLPGSGYYVLELDNYNRPLEIFVNPVRDFAKEKAEANIVFGPGLHEPVVVELKSHDRVYIDKDAVVKASFQATGVEDVKVSGYGIIDGGRNRRVGNACYREGMDGAIRIIDSSNIVFDGPVVLDSCCWCVAAFNSRDLELKNLKVTGAWRYNTDGIDICNSQRVRVHDCYVHSFDDTLVVKGLSHDYVASKKVLSLDFTPQEAVEDIAFERCVCWCGWGRTLEIGFETWATKFEKIRFEDCDLIHNSMGAISVHLGGPAKVKDVVYRDIRAEFTNGELGFQLQKERDDVYKPHPAGGRLIVIGNAKMFGDDFYKIDKGSVYAKEPYGTVDGLVIEDVKVYREEGAAIVSSVTNAVPGTTFGTMSVKFPKYM